MTVTTTLPKAQEAVIYAELSKAVTRLVGTLTDDLYKIAVLRFISDRTFGYQKLSEEIPVRHFLEGVQSKAKGITCTGLKMSEAKLYECLRWARDEGVVVTTKLKRKVRYAIKRERILALVPPKTRDKIAPALILTDDRWGAGEPREKVHSVEVSASESLHEVDVHLKNHCPFRTEEETMRSAPKVAPDACPVASPCSEAAEGHPPAQPIPTAASDVVRPSPPAPIQFAQPAPPPPKISQGAKHGRVPRELWASTLFDRFDTAVGEFWPDTGAPQAPSGKLRGQWEHFARSWRRTDISVADWITWCVQNWRTLYATTFQLIEAARSEEGKKLAVNPWLPKSHWRTPMEYPEYPDFKFLFGYRDQFIRDYNRRDTQKIRAGLTRRDRLLRQLTYKGFSLADAEREADEVLAREKVREDLDARARDLNAAARRLQSREQDLDTRIALGKARLAVQPVSLTKQALKVVVTHDIDQLPPLPTRPEWKDEEEEAVARANATSSGGC